MRLRLSACVLGLLLLTLGGCSGLLPKTSGPGYYRVQPGETLTTIAWRFHLPRADLAKWNHIEPDQQLKPGELLRMRPPREAGAARPGADREERQAADQDGESRPRYHAVAKGDNLATIGWRYQLDHQRIAAWNELDPPYTIYPGQKLRLYPPQDAKSAADDTQETAPQMAKLPLPGEHKPANTAPARRAPAAGADSGRKQTPAKPATPPRAAADGNEPAPPAAEPQAGAATPVPSEATLQAEPDQPTAPAPAAEPAKAQSAWVWPLQGQVIRQFAQSAADKQGIAIAGRPGAAIVAAKAGRVVYSGSGLVGYGRLIIIKHDEHYISAYGHNRRLLVAEGRSVTAGQQIAELGSSGAARPLLHFEIRLDGQPIDPLTRLPARP